MFKVRYGLSPYVLKRHVLSLKNLPGRGITKVEKHCNNTYRESNKKEYLAARNKFAFLFALSGIFSV